VKDHSGFAYLIRAENGLYKIGHARDPQVRLQNLDTGPLALELIHQVASNDPVWLEREMHKRFRRQRVRGEWFALSERQVEFICAVERCDRPQLLRRPKPCKRQKASTKPYKMVRVPLELYERLRRVAKKQRRPVSWEIKIALENHVEKNGEPAPQEDQP
jgi:predicted DNA-binding protein